MGGSIEISGNAIVYLFYASSLAIVPVLAYFVVWPVDDPASLAGAGLLLLLVLVAVADFRHWKRGGLREHLGAVAERNLPYDITDRPVSDPGQAAKEYWLSAVRRLPDGDDEEE